MKRALQLLAAGSLALCVYSAVAAFRGTMTIEAYKDWFLVGTAGWFVFATAALRLGPHRAAD